MLKLSFVLCLCQRTPSAHRRTASAIPPPPPRQRVAVPANVSILQSPSPELPIPPALVQSLTTTDNSTQDVEVSQPIVVQESTFPMLPTQLGFSPGIAPTNSNLSKPVGPSEPVIPVADVTPRTPLTETNPPLQAPSSARAGPTTNKERVPAPSSTRAGPTTNQERVPVRKLQRQNVCFWRFMSVVGLHLYL